MIKLNSEGFGAENEGGDEKMDTQIPPAPWKLTGDAVVVMASPVTLRALVHYKNSPVGSYQEHALVRPSLRGPHVYQMSVSSRESKDAGRALWGFPKTGEKLRWRRANNHIEFHRADHITHIHLFGPRLPIKLPFWTAQKREGKWVLVLGQVKAQLGLCRVGRGLGFWLEKMELTIAPPRRVL